jgi:HAD superfamily hydrolase (TIGR01509 family)
MGKPADVEAVLFDFDGTLSDTEVFGNELNRQAFEQFGIEPTEEEIFSIVGTDGVESIPAIFAAHGRPGMTLADFMTVRPDPSVIYRTMPVTLMPGAREKLDELAGRGIRMAIASNTIGCNVVYALDRLDILRYFDAVVTGDMVSERKPSPEIFELALTFLDADPARTVVVDDSPSGIAAAKAAGLYTIAFAGGSVPQDQSAADEIIDTFSKLEI